MNETGKYVIELDEETGDSFREFMIKFLTNQNWNKELLKKAEEFLLIFYNKMRWKENRRVLDKLREIIKR